MWTTRFFQHVSEFHLFCNVTIRFSMALKLKRSKTWSLNLLLKSTEQQSSHLYATGLAKKPFFIWIALQPFPPDMSIKREFKLYLFLSLIFVYVLWIQDEGVLNPGLSAFRCPSDHCCCYKICPGASNSLSRNSGKEKKLRQLRPV